MADGDGSGDSGIGAPSDTTPFSSVNDQSNNALATQGGYTSAITGMGGSGGGFSGGPAPTSGGGPVSGAMAGLAGVAGGLSQATGGGGFTGVSSPDTARALTNAGVTSAQFNDAHAAVSSLAESGGLSVSPWSIPEVSAGLVPMSSAKDQSRMVQSPSQFAPTASDLTASSQFGPNLLALGNLSSPVVTTKSREIVTPAAAKVTAPTPGGFTSEFASNVTLPPILPSGQLVGDTQEPVTPTSVKTRAVTVASDGSLIIGSPSAPWAVNPVTAADMALGEQYAQLQAPVRNLTYTPGRPMMRDDPTNNGYDVSTLQRNLAAAGYYKGSIDGIYGPATANAVGRMQAGREGTAGPQDRIAGLWTQNVASSLAAPSPRLRPDTGGVVAAAGGAIPPMHPQSIPADYNAGGADLSKGMMKADQITANARSIAAGNGAIPGFPMPTAKQIEDAAGSRYVVGAGITPGPAAPTVKTRDVVTPVVTDEGNALTRAGNALTRALRSPFFGARGAAGLQTYTSPDRRSEATPPTTLAANDQVSLPQLGAASPMGVTVVPPNRTSPAFFKALPAEFYNTPPSAALAANEAAPAAGVQVAANDRIWGPLPPQNPPPGAPTPYGWVTPEEVLRNYPGLNYMTPQQYRDLYNQGIDPALPQESVPGVPVNTPQENIPMSAITPGSYYGARDPNTGQYRLYQRGGGGQTAVG